MRRAAALLSPCVLGKEGGVNDCVGLHVAGCVLDYVSASRLLDLWGVATLSRVVIRLVGFVCGFLLVDLGWLAWVAGIFGRGGVSRVGGELGKGV